MRVKKIAVTVILLLGLLQSISCSRGGGIVGRWQTEGVDETIEFRGDGTFKASNSNKSEEGKYTLVEDSRIKLEMGGSSTTIKYSVTGDELSFIHNEGRVVKLKRVG